MIGRLSGTVDTLDTDLIILDVQGVGYVVYASTKTLQTLTVGQSVKLFTEYLIRQETPTLFGFATFAEQAAFRLLTTVQGVGPKVALAILSVLTSDQLTLAIMSGDRIAIGQADGVGPKLANRIIAELKDKLARMMGTDSINISAPPGTAFASVQTDVASALVGLGYRPMDFHPIMTQTITDLGDSASVDQVLRATLQKLSPQRTA